MENQLINQLDPNLKIELMFMSYGKFLVSIPWIRDNFSIEFIKELSQDAEEV